MEQSRCLMWPSRRHGLSLQPTAHDDSWEEQAFAEDAAETLGAGCVWPPRSYYCSFCRREFRSAQALGGHMNVHRRERARLKQSPSPQAETPLQNHQNHIPNNHFASSGFQYPSQDCNLVYNHNPRPISPPSRILAAKDDLPHHQHTLFASFSSPNLDADKFHHFSELMKTEGEKKNMTILESGCRVNVQPDLSVSLNLVLRRSRPPTVSGGKEEESIGRKRRRTDATSLPLFLKPVSINKHQFKPADAIGLSPSSIDELDLELRLGDRPKKKAQPQLLLDALARVSQAGSKYPLFTHLLL